MPSFVPPLLSSATTLASPHSTAPSLAFPPSAVVGLEDVAAPLRRFPCQEMWTRIPGRMQLHTPQPGGSLLQDDTPTSPWPR